ncbi:MAG: phage terminase large subunit [Nitrosotalea sp.]
MVALDDPVTFCRVILDFSPFSYQQKFILDKAGRIVVCAGRQVGKSEMTSARAIWFAVSHPKTNTLIISATLRQSMLMFDKILNKIEASYLVKKYVTYRSRTRVKLQNGSWIIALPCGRTGATLRGFTAHQLIFDEAAFIPEEVISEVALPMLATTSGNAIMLSTPLDKSHIFYKAFTSSTWSKYHFPSSINPKISKDFLDEMLALNGQQAFDQEYMAEFVEDQKSYFPMTLLRTCVHACEASKCEYCQILSEQSQNPRIFATLASEHRKFFAGQDPGGKQDPAALVVVEKMADETLRVVLTKTYLANPKEKDENLYTRFMVETNDIHQVLHFQKLILDSTGLGNPIIEHAKDLKLPAEGLQLTIKSKEQILSNIRLLLENKKIILPDDMTLLMNLNCIEAERTMAGRFSFSHPQGSHDDLAYALALACWAATKPTATVIINKGE